MRRYVEAYRGSGGLIMRIIYEFQDDDEKFERQCFERGPAFYKALTEISSFVQDMHDDIDKNGLADIDIEDVLADLKEIILISGFGDV